MIKELRLSYSLLLYDYLTFLDTWVIEFQSMSSNQVFTLNAYPLDSIFMQFKRYALLKLDFGYILSLALSAQICVICNTLECLPAICK